MKKRQQQTKLYDWESQLGTSLHFSKSCETFVTKYKIICPCPEVAITSWQHIASIRPEMVLTSDVTRGSTVEDWFQQLDGVLAMQMLTGKVLLKLLNTRAEFLAKTPAGSPSTPLPSLLCLFKEFVCIKLPETLFLGLSGWDSTSM